MKPTGAEMSEEYYILSMKWTGKGMYDDLVTFWRPDNSGYTVYLNAAGRYKESELRSDIKRLPVAWPWPENTPDSVAVPCALVDAMAQPFVPNESEVLAAISSGEVAERYAKNTRPMHSERKALEKIANMPMISFAEGRRAREIARAALKAER
jgi:hypothetical protein